MGEVLLTVGLTVLATFAWVFIGRLIVVFFMGVDKDNDSILNERPTLWFLGFIWPFVTFGFFVVKVVDEYTLRRIKKPDELSLLQRFDKFFWQLGYRVRLLFVKG